MTDRQARDLPLDAHVHTNLSPDSNVAIDDYAASALERGIAEIAITDHVDFEPGAPAFAFTTFEDRERIVRSAAERWGPQGVHIRFGVELTYDRSWEADIRDHLARYAYDFTIGSVHDRVDSPYSPARSTQPISPAAPVMRMRGTAAAFMLASSFDLDGRYSIENGSSDSRPVSCAMRARSASVSSGSARPSRRLTMLLFASISPG